MVDTPNAPDHRGAVLRALSQVPVATTRQLAKLNNSLQPLKKASAILRSLEQERLVESWYHDRGKVWRLTRKGRTACGVSPVRSTSLAHALAVGNLYFTLRPNRWMYEPREPFEHLGQQYEWRPDCIFVHQRKLYACEVQRSLPPGRKPWERKWRIYNMYFNHGYYRTASFQEWSKSTIAPEILVISKQSPETVISGFGVHGRELIFAREWMS